MKTLILIRHAKSSWEDPGSDIERPLNERGKKDAPEMARRVKEKISHVDQFVSSPAKRARKTAKYFADEFGMDKDDIKIVEDLYAATAEAFSNTVAALDDQCNTVALFSHNPGITEFASSLSNSRVDDMPTCAVFVVQADTGSWTAFGNAEMNFLFFDYPKSQ